MNTKKFFLAIFMVTSSFECTFILYAQESSFLMDQDLYQSAGLESDNDFGLHESYDAVCDTIAPKPMPRWQVWLSYVGTPLLTAYLAIRSYLEKKALQARRYVAALLMRKRAGKN